MKRKGTSSPILQPPKRFRTKWPDEPMTVREAKAIVRASLKVLDDLAKGWRGGVRPETKEAFRVVLKAASR